MSCTFCSTNFHHRGFTNPISKNKADVALLEKRKLVFTGDNSSRYSMPITYCPVCGKRLDQEQHSNERNHSTIIRSNMKTIMAFEHVSLHQLSNKTGIAKSTLSDFLNGKTQSMAAEKVAVVADALNVSVERLFIPFPDRMTHDEGLAYDIPVKAE